MSPPTTRRVDPELATRLRLAVTRLSRRLRQHAESGATPSQLSALAAIERHGPVTLGELAAYERVQPPTMTKIVGALEQLGLVQRDPDLRDRRMVRATITPQGRRFIERTRERKTAFLDSRLRHFTEDELAVLQQAVPLLERLVEDGR